MELQNGLDQLRNEGIKLYAISYDDTAAVADFSQAAGIGFTMLSDVDSRVIRQYDVLNTIVQPEDAPFYGVPFPGFFLLNEDGAIVDKLFNRHFALREGVESIADSFLGRVTPGDREPIASFTEDDGIEITAFLRGGGGVLRIGPRRRLVVRFAMPEGIHIYDDPVPDGMVATQIDVEGPDGLRLEPVESPATAPFALPGVDAPLQVWGGTVDFVVPLFANTELAPVVLLDPEPSIELKIKVRYQACDDRQCFIPQTRTIELHVPLGMGPMPGFDRNRDLGVEVIDMDSEEHLRRLMQRHNKRLADED